MSQQPLPPGLRVQIDRFGVPDNLLGPHTDDFYACVGRVVTLSALLENRLLDLVGQQVGRTVPRAKLAAMVVSELIQKGKETLDSYMDEPSRLCGEEFFARAQNTIVERNHIVHSLWPAQAEGLLFAWRPTRRASQPDTKITRSQSDISELVLAIVKLLDDCQRLSMRIRVPVGNQ